MNYVVEILILLLLAVTSVSAQSKAASGDVEISGATYTNGTSSKHSVERKDADPGVIKVGPPTTYLKNGLRIDEVTHLLGKPVYVSERQGRNGLISTYVFRRGEDRIVVAEFAKGILKRSSVKKSEELPEEKVVQRENVIKAKFLQ
jgi:hypothetical protein